MSFALLAPVPTEAPPGLSVSANTDVVPVDTISPTTTTDQENGASGDVPESAVESVAKSAAPESDSDEDDWDEISKGRYFGAGDGEESGPLCHNCKQTGHKKKDCPHQLCRSCGALDDHDTMRCPMTQRCYNCSRLGHVASKCPEPARQLGSFCRECGSKGHLERSCPQIWRLYMPAANFDVDGDWEVEAWCYNCANQGHYGDDCPRPHRMRLVEQSAFCQANQPESRTDRSRRDAYERTESKRHQRLDEEELQEDWFARQNKPGGAGTYRPNPNHNSFQSGNDSYRYPPPPPPPPLPPPPSSAASRRVRQDVRYDPYARPSGPIITSERYPRGLPAQRGTAGSGGGYKGTGKASYKRVPVPAAQRLASQNQTQTSRTNTRGGKSYRGGGGRR